MNLPPFRIETSPQNGLLHVAVSGELDIATAPRLDAALQQPEAATGIVLDLTRVSFIDSTGLRVLLQAHEAARHGGRQLTILPSDVVTRLIRMTGFSQRLLNDVDDRSSTSATGLEP
jgi:anti-anti-sigma factor